MDKNFDYIVCMCMGVSYSSIVEEIQNGTREFGALCDKLGMCIGCGSCKQEVKAILKRELEKLEENKKI